MKRALFGVFVGVAAAGAMMAAQGQVEPAGSASQATTPQAGQTRPADPKPDSTLTGCVIQGSGPTVFILDNARMSRESKEKGKQYVLAAASSSVDLRSQLNHEVTVTGISEEKPMPSTGQGGATVQPPAGQSPSAVAPKIDEKDLPKLSAKTVTKVADTCSVAG